MSLTYEESPNNPHPIAYDVESNEIVFYDEKDINGCKKAEGIFEWIPDIRVNMSFGVLFVVGQMGAGKTHFIMQVAEQYKRIFPNGHIYYFCQKPSDPTVDEHHGLKIERIQFDETFMSKQIDITRDKCFHNGCMCIFDDFFTIPDKKVVEKILQIVMQCITLGRQYKIYTSISSHMMYGFKNKEIYASIETEATQMCWFKGVNVHQLVYVLQNYWGYDKSQIKKMLRFDNVSRWTLINRFPAYILTQNKCAIIN